MTRAAAATLAMALLVAEAGAQEARLDIVSPSAGDYVSDRVVVDARVTPEPRARDVTEYTFFADGKEICRIAAPSAPSCPWDAGAVVKAHQLRVVATLSDGSRLVTTRRTRAIDVAENTAVRVVQVPAVVTGRDGGFVRGLPRDAFTVTEDGVLQAVEHFSAEEAPLQVVLAFDLSSSMTDALADMKNAVEGFARRLPGNATVSLLAFNDEMFPVGQRTDSLERRLDIMRNLQALGGTALYDAMMRSLDDLARGSGRRALVVFSDGDDQSSHATRDHLRAALEASDVSVYFVALGRGREVLELLKGMETLAALTGGRTLQAERTSDLEKRFDDVLDELSNQYLLGYTSTNGRLDGSWRKIEVRVKRPDLKVRARLGYRAAVPQ